jgi:hypothetical protein
MTRPLLDKSILELTAIAERNRANRAELELIRAELRHRSTSKAHELAKQVDWFLATVDETPPDADPGKYARVHAAAIAAGSPVVLGWKHADAVFAAGESQHDGSSVYGTIHAIAREAGSDGIAAAALVTALRHRQIGNTRSQYCDGLPPIGWAEGWIDTAVTRHVIIEHQTGAAAPGVAVERQPSRRGRPTLSLEDVAERVRKYWKVPSALRIQRDRLARMDTPEAEALLLKVDARLADWDRKQVMRAASQAASPVRSLPRQLSRPADTGISSHHSPPRTAAPKDKPMTEARRWTE